MPTRSRGPQPSSGREPEEGLERVYQDRSLSCRDCGEGFTFSAGRQAVFAQQGRATAKRARANEGPREFHAAICGACGGQAIVPFAPRNDRPVYCSSCFDKVRAGTLTATVTVYPNTESPEHPRDSPGN